MHKDGAGFFVEKGRLTGYIPNMICLQIISTLSSFVAGDYNPNGFVLLGQSPKTKNDRVLVFDSANILWATYEAPYGPVKNE